MKNKASKLLTIILKYDGSESEWNIEDVTEKDANNVEQKIDKIYYDLP